MKLAVYTHWRFGWTNAGEGLRITFVYDAAKKFSRVNITRQLAEKFRHDAFTLTPKGFAHDRLGLLNRAELAVVDNGENFQRLPRWLNASELCRQFLAFCRCLDEAIRWSSTVEQRAQGVVRAEARLERSFAFCFAPEMGITFHFLDEHLSIQLDRYHSAQLNVAACERALASVNYSAPTLCCVHSDSPLQDCFCYACIVRLLLDSERARVWLFACLTLYLDWRSFVRANISNEHKTAYDAVYSVADLFVS